MGTCDLHDIYNHNPEAHAFGVYIRQTAIAN